MDNDLKSKDEKTVINAFRIDGWSRRNFYLSIISFLMSLYFISASNSPSLSGDTIDAFNLFSTLFLFLGLILLIISFLLLFIGYVYKSYYARNSNLKENINSNLTEFFAAKDPRRHKTIILNLGINLMLLRDKVISNVPFFYQYQWKIFFKIIRKKNKFRYKILEEFSNFLSNAIAYMSPNEYQEFAMKFSALLVKDDYLGMNQLLLDNKPLLEKIEVLKQKFDPRGKPILSKIKTSIEFTTKNYYSIIILILIILILLGKTNIFSLI